MKKNSIIALLVFTVFLSANVLMALAIPEPTNYEISTDGAKWLKNHKRAKKLVRESIQVEISGEGNSLTGTLSVTGSAQVTFVWVECCKYTSEDFYYCNAALQDKRC